jgi:hypothetical protein
MGALLETYVQLGTTTSLACMSSSSASDPWRTADAIAACARCAHRQSRFGRIEREMLERLIDVTTLKAAHGSNGTRSCDENPTRTSVIFLYVVDTKASGG